MGTLHKIEDIKIAVHGLAEAGIEQRHTIGPQEMAGYLADENLVLEEPFALEYVLSRVEDTVHASIRVHGRIHTACVRCLEPLTHEVDLALETDYLPALPGMPEDLEAERQSSELGYYRREIPLGEYIISELVLSLPMRYVCSPDCRGLCPRCGANWNRGACDCHSPVDPRLEKLAALKKTIRR